MQIKKISIIGTGHIGRALFQGLITGNSVTINQVILTNHHLGKIKDLQKEFGVDITSNNIKAIKDSDIIFLAARPRDIKSVIQEIRKEIDTSKIIISLAACVTTKLLEKYFNSKDLRIIRIIPNIPVNYGKGIIGWLGSSTIRKSDERLIKKLLSPLGLLIRCKDDDQLERLSMISGCGIGYVAYFMDNLKIVARQYGFSEESSDKIVRQTFSGTIEHLDKTDISFADLIKSVATKGGITEEVLANLDIGKFQKLLSQSIEKGYSKVGRITYDLYQEI